MLYVGIPYSLKDEVDYKTSSLSNYVKNGGGGVGEIVARVNPIR